MGKFHPLGVNANRPLVPLDAALAQRDFRAHPVDRSDPAPEDLQSSYVPPGEPAAPCTNKISLQPFVWRDPAAIPPRQWLYGRHFIRGYVTATVAPAGLGKSSLLLVEALAMASGRALLGAAVKCPLKVWMWNGEDPVEELRRRVGAIMLHYDVTPDEIAGRLFLNSGRADPIVLASKAREAIVVDDAAVSNIVQEIKGNGVDVVIIDPFVSSHAVPENDNGAIDRVAKTWARIAEEANCAVELVHHVRKPSSGQAAFTVDDARGASALIGAARSARALNAMTQEEAQSAGVSESRRSYFRVDDADGKRNMMPPMETAAWYHLVSVALGNGTADEPGDHVGVATSWTLPNAFDDVTADHLKKVQDKIASGEWRHSVQAEDWAGYAVADVLGLDANEKAHQGKIKTLLKTWVANGVLKVERTTDKKGKERPTIVVGERI